MAYLFTLQNDNGAEVRITNYGAIVTSVRVRDRNGNTDNIVCGFDQLGHYLDPRYLGNYPYFGAIIGRVANRIQNGRFNLNGIPYQLAVNNGPNHLHGGNTGYDRRLWHAEMMEEEDKVGLLLSYFSPHLEENYPGNLEISCLYLLNNQNELSVDYFGTTDQTTLINLTNHTYFNLTGGKENILNHELVITAGHITESVDLIPTGKIIPVKGTPYDFTSGKRIGRDIGSLENGYDLNYVLDNDDEDLVYAASLREYGSGRQVEVFTTQPGIQLYSGYWIPELEIDGVTRFGKYSGVALETQHFPDTPNQPGFPPIVLGPGEKYQQCTVFRFGLTD